LMQIIFSFEIAPEDNDHLDHIITQHNALFVDLFIRPLTLDDEDDDEEEVDVDNPQETIDGDSEPEDEEEGEEENGVPASRRAFIVYVINKLHHLEHYCDMINQYGSPVRVWCAKFEGRLKIFRQHSAVCCNFRNPPLTMAKMFQLSNLKSFQCDLQDQIEHQSGTSMRVSDSPHADLVRQVNRLDEDIITFVSSVTVNGEEYRTGLFVCLPGSTPRQPIFGRIQQAIVSQDQSVYFIVAPWKVLELSPRYNTYIVCVECDTEVK